MSVDRDQRDRPALDDSGLAIQLGEGTFKLIQAGDGSYKEFLKVLSRLGGGPFEELILVQDVPDTTTSVALPTEDDDRNIPRPISLPPFKKLSIDCSASTCSSIMRHITIPQIETLTLKLRARPYETRDERFAMLLPLALDSASRSVIAPASARVIASLSITWGNVISILAWTTSLPPSQFFFALQTEPDPRCSIPHLPTPSLYACLEGYPADVVMSALCAAIPVPNLTMLSLTESSSQASENERLDARRFSLLLWLAPTVETLSISITLATDLPRLLSPNTAHPDGPKLPQLKVLNIGPSALDYHKEGNNCRPSLARLPELIDVLCNRMTVGSGLDMLRIPHYFLDNLLQAQTEKLRRCAAAVHLSRYPDADVIWKAAEMV